MLNMRQQRIRDTYLVLLPWPFLYWLHFVHKSCKLDLLRHLHFHCYLLSQKRAFDYAYMQRMDSFPRYDFFNNSNVRVPNWKSNKYRCLCPVVISPPLYILELNLSVNLPSSMQAAHNNRNRDINKLLFKWSFYYWFPFHIYRC